MRLERYQHGFGRGDAAGASQAIGQGDLSRRMILDGDVVFGDDFIRILDISVSKKIAGKIQRLYLVFIWLLQWQGLHRFDARDTW